MDAERTATLTATLPAPALARDKVRGSRLAVGCWRLAGLSISHRAGLGIEGVWGLGTGTGNGNGNGSRGSPC